MNKRINLSPMELRSDTYNGFVSSKTDPASRANNNGKTVANESAEKPVMLSLFKMPYSITGRNNNNNNR